ncbi:hypothetical protein CAOG_09079 [Capsaspora owczarzaki ATCC 30864]|uniref:SRA1/Sec31 domain-containing protein n=1 Tax=Capsaspora owczarzaki (strain ATCC 30864) TaxID=595528 RepID=A0A0D2WWV2_CAPO3|nr:hypothetical protein CAOG_09079 [Capsaspora owczarzaki ATCC 30864]KJE97525.1 hypothetical protein CAOG_009079 [Capsaspora owczarzaki ATCC 30864]|eukprot:XP_011270812.1 hypothetical protein CAOG_09079 [Capsaspora owczarzaki ATCC 30864]
MEYKDKDRTRERGWNDPPPSLLGLSLGNGTETASSSVSSSSSSSSSSSASVSSSSSNGAQGLTDPFAMTFELAPGNPAAGAPPGVAGHGLLFDYQAAHPSARSGRVARVDGLAPTAAPTLLPASASNGPPPASGSMPPPGPPTTGTSAAASALIAASSAPAARVDQADLRSTFVTLLARCPEPQPNDPMAAKKSHDDMKRRVGMLLAKCEADQLSASVAAVAQCLATQLTQGQFDQASETHIELVTKHFDEAGQWIVGVKRLISELRQVASQQAR